MRVEEAVTYLGAVARQVGAPIREVRVEPLPGPYASMLLRDDALILGPALVRELSPEALAFAVVQYLRGPSVKWPVLAPVLIVSGLLGLGGGGAVVHHFGPNLAGFLVAVPLALAGLVVYAMLLLVPLQWLRMGAATRRGLRIAGLAGAEEYVAKRARYALGQEALTEYHGWRAPERELARLRATARRMGLA